MSSKFWNGKSPDDTSATWVDMPFYVEDRTDDEQFYYMLGVRDEHARIKPQAKPTKKNRSGWFCRMFHTSYLKGNKWYCEKCNRTRARKLSDDFTGMK
jgi:hypothetical protein